VRLAPIAALLCLILGFGALPASADAVDSAVAAARGSGLAIQSDAEATANASASRQAANLAISHASISHLTSVCTRAAEIVGSGPSVDLVFSAFRGSPNHWSKLTDPGWTSMGTGAVVGADGKVYVSVVFCQGAGGSPAPPPAPAPQPAPSPAPAPAPGGSAGATTAPASQPAAGTVEMPDVEVDLVGLLTAILTTSLDSLTAEHDAEDPIASILERYVSLPSGVMIV
jgi:hypothetical protein